MKKLIHRIWVVVTSFWRIHIGINSALAFVLIAIVVYRYFLKDILTALFQSLSASFDPLSATHTLILGIISSVIAALIFVFLGVFLLGWYGRIKLTGKYQAFVIEDNGTETDWGTVTIKYYPFSSTTDQTPVKMQLTHKDIVMEGWGLIIDNRYLTGHYTETGKPERRRSGSFMYELDGTGNTWRGDFICIDPVNSGLISGKGKWVKV